MHEPTYREAVRTAWGITKKHKFLLIFGLFAVFVGQLGVLDLITKVGFIGAESTPLPLWAVLPILGYGSTITIAGITLQTTILLAWLAVIILGFVCMLTFVSVVCHGALIHATGQYIHHPHKHVSLGDAWHAGVGHFWRLFFIIFLKKITITALAVGISFALLNAVTYASSIDVVVFLSLFIISLIVGFIISLIAVYAAGYVVLENYRLREALPAAWELLREHWLVSLEIGMTVLGLNVLTTVFAIAMVPILFIPTIILWGAASGITSSFILIQIGTFLAAGILLFLIATVGSVLNVFTTALWMDLFQNMHRRGIVSRIVQFFSRS